MKTAYYVFGALGLAMLLIVGLSFGFSKSDKDRDVIINPGALVEIHFVSKEKMIELVKKTSITADPAIVHGYCQTVPVPGSQNELSANNKIHSVIYVRIDDPKHISTYETLALSHELDHLADNQFEGFHWAALAAVSTRTMNLDTHHTGREQLALLGFIVDLDD